MASVRFRLHSARRTGWLLGLALIAGPVAAPPVFAQSADEMRVRKLEQEVRALQRKVFPGGDGRYFEPQITAQPANPRADTADAGSTGAITDLLARMDAVEAALAQLTAQTEVNSNALNLLSARVDALESARAAMAAPAPATRYEEELEETPPPAASSATRSNAEAMRGSQPAAETEPASATVERPETGDPADDAYVYGYRLWDAGRHAEARKALEAMVGKYPRHRRASWARNLIGRSYLDQKQPRPAAEIFLKNYLENRDGERAPDSLVYLAQATLQIGNKAKACEALEEFRLVYPGEASGRLSSLSQQVASRAACD